MNKIYTLSDENGTVRYVGKSVNPHRRLVRHLIDARSGIKDHKSTWIRSLLSRGIEPIVELIEECENWQEREKYWIAFFRKKCQELGTDLTNFLDGGESGPVGKKWSDEMREKRKQNWARKTPEEKRLIAEKISSSNIGKPHSNEHNANMKEALKKPDVISKMRNKERVNREARNRAITEKWNSKTAEEKAEINRRRSEAIKKARSLRFWSTKKKLPT